MTNRERVIKAIRHENPDYTPHNVLFTNQMHRKMVEYTGNPRYADTLNNHISIFSIRKPHVYAPDPAASYTDEFGVVWDISGADKDIGVVSQPLIRNAEDLAAYTPPPIDEEYIRKICEKAVLSKGDNFLIGSIGYTLFERAWSLCGMEDLLCYMLTDPEAVESLLDKLAERNVQKAKIALEYGMDCILFGDDWGQQRGMIMGAPLWRRFIKPCLAKMYGEVKAAGKFVAQHSCGDLREILDELIEIGLDIYQTFQPEIYDKAEYKQKLNRRLTIWGGISTQAELPFMPPEEIYELTKANIALLGKGGGYIAAPTHAVPGDVPPENIAAMVSAFKNQL